MIDGPVLLDSDTTSELSRGHPRVIARARAYLKLHGRFTFSAVTVFERLRGYRAALRIGKPFEPQMRMFQMLMGASIVLPVDTQVAEVAASIWSQLGVRPRRELGDILIAATASANELPLVTRNRRDFDPIARLEGIHLALVNWTR